MKESATEEGNLVNIPRISKAMVAEGDDESTDECIDENWENKPKRMFKLESGELFLESDRMATKRVSYCVFYL